MICAPYGPLCSRNYTACTQYNFRTRKVLLAQKYTPCANLRGPSRRALAIRHRSSLVLHSIIAAGSWDPPWTMAEAAQRDPRHLGRSYCSHSTTSSAPANCGLLAFECFSDPNARARLEVRSEPLSRLRLRLEPRSNSVLRRAAVPRDRPPRTRLARARALPCGSFASQIRSVSDSYRAARRSLCRRPDAHRPRERQTNRTARRPPRVEPALSLRSCAAVRAVPADRGRACWRSPRRSPQPGSCAPRPESSRACAGGRAVIPQAVFRPPRGSRAPCFRCAPRAAPNSEVPWATMPWQIAQRPRSAGRGLD